MSKLRLSLIDPSPLKQSPSEEYLSPRRKKLQRSEFDFLNFPRIKLEEKELEVTEENIRVAHQIQEIRALRRKYVYHPTEEKYICQVFNGVFQVYETDHHLFLDMKKPKFYAPATYDQFLEDRITVIKMIQDGAVKSYSQKRLEILSSIFDFHVLLNSYLEMTSTTNDLKDFYTIKKVDNHVHLAAAMTGRQLLDFMLRKLASSPDDHVLKDKEGNWLTLKEVLEQAHPEPKDLTTDFLDVNYDRSMFHRFDKFNAKYNPCGVGQLREIFLKSSNDIGGKYFGELTKELLTRNEKSKYVCTEYRLSIYGRSMTEWDELAKWYLKHDLKSTNNKWMIQLPRIYDYLNKSGKANNFEEYLTTVFLPLFEVTIDPKSHPELAEFLKEVVAIDSCDDESVFEDYMPQVLPRDWVKGNPPYAYYMYYTWSNLYALNLLRETKGLHPLVFRPHAGEAGSKFHLADCYLVAQSINHGIELRNTPALQYLYYLDQIGLSVSPLSNNALFLKFRDNPFFDFFKRGLNVTLSTDDPLQFHSTEDPLIEEYSAAAQIWKLTTTDMSEIARNSVLQSSFPAANKSEWIGHLWDRGVNDIDKTNISEIRIFFRDETYENELSMLEFYENHRKSDVKSEK